jgi:hypothetical protein
MRLASEELKDLYRRRTARVPQHESECLAEDALLRAASGEMSQPERELVVNHLMTCADCSEEYRLLLSVKEWANDAVPSAKEETHDIETIAADSSDTSRSQEQRGSDKARSKWWWRQPGLAFQPMPYAIAALLLILTLALGIAVLTLRRNTQQLTAQLNEQMTRKDETIAATNESLAETRRQLEEANRRAEQEAAARRAEQEAATRSSSAPAPSSRRAEPDSSRMTVLRQTVNNLSEPQLNVPIVNLDPQGDTRGGQQTAASIELQKGANLFTLVLNVTGEAAHENYALEILDQRGKRIWHGKGLRRSPYNTYTVVLSRRLLPAGQYRLKLYGLTRNDRELIEDYAVKISDK